MYHALFALIAVAAAEPAAAVEIVGPLREPPVKVWLDKRGTLDKGDRVRVRVRTELDGYLVVLHAEPDGRVRVLFPLDPYHDNFIRGSEDYELPGRGDRETFRVFASQGVGTVFAAYSRDPFQIQDFVRGDHWDYLLAAWQINEDAEAELVLLAEQMSLGRFDYDLVRYGVGRTITAGYSEAGNDRYGSRSSSSFHLSFGVGRTYLPFSVRFRRAYYYSHCNDWYWYDSYYHDSWFCDPYRYSHYDPWFPYWYDPYHRGAWYYDRYHYRRPRPVIVYYPGTRGSDARFIDRRFTLKDDHNIADGSGLLDMRRRVPSSGATVRRTLATGDAQSGRRTVSDTRRVGTTTQQTDRRRPAATIERRPDVGSPTVIRRPADTRRPEAGPTTVAPRRPVDAEARRPQPVEVKPENRRPDQPATVRRLPTTVRERPQQPPRRVEPSRPAPQIRQPPPTVRRVPTRAVPSRTPTVRRSPSPRVRAPVRSRVQRVPRVAPRPRVVRPTTRKPVRRKKN